VFTVGALSDGNPLATPIPPSLPLFASGLALMGWLAWRKRRLSAVTVPEEADIADIDPLRMIEAELVILLSEAPAIASKQVGGGRMGIHAGRARCPHGLAGPHGGA